MELMSVILSETPFLESTFGMVLIQAIGIIAMAFGILSFQGKTNRSIIVFMMISALFWTIHMALMKKPAGVLMNLIGMVRGITYAFKDKKKFLRSWVVPSVFIVFIIAAGIYSFKFEKWLTLLPCAAMAIQTIVFFQDNPKVTRLCSYVVSPCWLVYDGLIHSIGGVLCEIFAMTSITISLIRYRNKDKEKKEE